MPNSRVFRGSFAGGEISRELFGRIDIAKVASGVDTCRNFIIQPHGVASNRPGFQYVNEIKNSANPARLIQFSFSSSQTFVVEMGAGYFRFHSNGATLLNAGVPYEVANTYAQGDLFDIRYVQSGDVITLVHPSYPPKELKRLSNLNWTFTSISFSSQTAAPVVSGVSGCVATYPTAGVNKTFKYVVTAVNSLGYEESPASAATNIVTNDLTIVGNFNTITWAAVTGAVRYNLYKYSNGSYAYAGQTPSLSMVDDNILADLTRTIPINDAVFNSAGNYPSSVCYYEQRRFFAGTTNQPQNVWATQSSSDNNMSYSIPSQASDALRFKVAAQRSNSILHLIPTLDLMMMTASTEWRINSGTGAALSASTITVKSQAQNGASKIQPITVNNFILYGQAQGGHIREMSYQWQSSGYISNDLSLLAPHLFDYNTIVDMTFSRAPVPILWSVNNSGALIGLTYVPEQQVSAWHKHDTDGLFESCAAITENNSDVLYVIINRTINGITRRYIEFLHTRYFARTDDAFFVDCGLTYSGAPASVISGLGYLEGKTVSILGDGAVISPQVVVAGQITLPYPVSMAQIGLSITADLITAPAVIAGDITSGQSRIKNVNKTWTRVYRSGAFSAGPNANKLTPIRARHFENPGSPPSLATDELAIVVTPNFNQSGQIMIRQSDPLPLTIVDVTIEASIDG